jgi:hypothetical protein
MDWNGFCTYLQRNYSETTLSITWAYARKYCEYVFKDDVSGLGQIEGSKRDNAIKSLSVLAKFLGRADKFKLKLARADSLKSPYIQGKSQAW